MRRAREAVLARGGAERANVFTRIMLALFGFIPWRAVPVMPVEIMLLPTVVSVPPRQDLVLEPHRHRSVAGADGEEAARAQRQRRAHRRTFRCAAADASARRRKRRSRKRHGSGSSAASTTCCARPSRCFPQRTRQRAIDGAVAWVTERSQRRGRPRRDFPGDGEQRDDVRRARLSGRSSAARDRAQIGREAVGRARARGLLPALRLADLGYRPHLLTRCWRSAASALSRRSSAASIGSCRSKCSMSAATGSRGGRISAPAAGPSNTPIRIIPTSTTPPSSPWRWIACRA